MHIPPWTELSTTFRPSLHIESTIIDTALLDLHDWSHYISCEPAEIEAERGVIREEWRRGDDARSRMMKGISKIEQTGSRFAERDVIGLMDVVNNFTPQTLIDYYHKCTARLTSSSCCWGY
jgi:zinc protease